MIKLEHKDFMDPKIGLSYRFVTKHVLFSKHHDHDFFELFLVTSGSVGHDINGETFALSKGALVLVSPKDRHHLFPLQNSEFELFFSFIHPNLLAEIYEFLQFNEKRIFSTDDSYHINLTDEKTDEIRNRLSSLQIIPEDNYLSIRRHLLLFYIDMLSQFADYELIYKNSLKTNVPAWFANLLYEMRKPENIERGAESLVKLSGYSHGHLCAIFRQYMGTTIVKYVTDLRLIYAARLLSNSDLNILEISSKIGYTSLSHFIRIFKEKYNITPREYRNQKKSGII